MRAPLLLASSLLVGFTLVHQEPAGSPPAHWSGAEAFVAERNCLACHGAGESVVEAFRPKQAPDLTEVGRRVAPGYLRRFLSDPRGTRPGTTMPHVLGAAGAGAEEVESLVHFLASLGGPFDGSVSGASVSTIQRGRALFHSIGCVACHLPEEEPWELELPLDRVRELRAAGGEEDAEPEEDPYVLPGVPEPRDLPLDHLVGKTSVAELSGFLLDPLHVRPSGWMPSMGLDAKEAEAIALYLLRDQIDLDGAAPAPGIVAERFLGTFSGNPDFEAREPEDQILVDTFRIDQRERDEHFGFRFQGLIEVPADGEWTFFTTSDDGSRVLIDGELVVDNWGAHPPTTRQGSTRLSQGRHAIEVLFYEVGGGEELEVEWSGPGVERQEVPAAALWHVGLRVTPPAEAFELDPRRVEDGAALFEKLGCVSCHSTGAQWDLDSSAPDAPRFAELRVVDGGTCVGGADARWQPDEQTLTGLRELLGSGWVRSEQAPEHDAGARVARHLERMGCVYCHRRDQVGGVHPWNAEYFQAVEGTDLGDEGRIPPDLSGVGAKLRPATLRRVLRGEDAVRPYMTTRMPRFGEANIDWLVGALQEADPDLVYDRKLPPGGETLRSAGRLVGTKGGLGCIQCHDFAGTPSLGIRAVDLARMYERLEPGWFAAMLLDPQSLSTGTRMATLWTDGRSPVTDVFDGDPVLQVDAIWQYLSMGSDMPRPLGLEAGDAAFELVPEGGALACGVFMRDLSPRTVVVGFPQLVHYAYDVENGRLGKVWRGRFFNARGTWQGRAGQLELPPSVEAHDLPSGMPLALLEASDAPWPDGVGPAAGFEAHARDFGPDDTPTWWTRWEDRLVAESIAPDPGGAGLSRTITVWSPRPDEEVWLRVEPGWSGEVRGSDGQGFRFGGEAGWPTDAEPTQVRVLDTPDGPEYRVRLVPEDAGDDRPSPDMGTRYHVTMEMNW